MTATLLADPLWDLIQPFLPIPPRRPQGGGPRVSERACLTGIVFVLRGGIPWRFYTTASLRTYLVDQAGIEQVTS
jgi:transposase